MNTARKGFGILEKKSKTADDIVIPTVAELTGKYPMKWYGFKIYGVVAKGTEFEIIGLKRSTSKTMGEDFSNVRILSDGEFKGQEVCTRLLESFDGKELYQPEYAVELSSVGK